MSRVGGSLAREGVPTAYKTRLICFARALCVTLPPPSGHVVVQKGFQVRGTLRFSFANESDEWMWVCVCVMVGVALRICKLAKGEWNLCFLLFYFFSGKNNANYEQRHSRTHTNVRIR